MSEQLHFLASLDFPSRSTVMVREVAERLGYSVKHVCVWIEEHELEVLDGKSKHAAKSSWRITIESYRAFIIRRLSDGGRGSLLATLPRSTLREIHAEIGKVLKEGAAA